MINKIFACIKDFKQDYNAGAAERLGDEVVAAPSYGANAGIWARRCLTKG